MGNPKAKCAEPKEGQENLGRMFDQADRIDLEEGALAYLKYNQLLQKIADHYGSSLERTAAAFAALSPNNDYFGNLRSLISVLDGYRKGIAPNRITVSTYGHCRDRALQYLSGAVDFMQSVRGPKIRAFYQNIINPNDPGWVTIDGHMVAAWNGLPATMKESLVGRKQYEIVAAGCMALARERGILPNQYQATVWFVRKRVLRIKFDEQMDILAGPADQWRIMRELRDLRPYPIKGVQDENTTDKRSSMGRSTKKQLPSLFCRSAKDPDQETQAGLALYSWRSD